MNLDTQIKLRDFKKEQGHKNESEAVDSLLTNFAQKKEEGLSLPKYQCEGCKDWFDRNELKPYKISDKKDNLIFLCKKCEKVKEKYF